jgi:hypothetical protein
VSGGKLLLGSMKKTFLFVALFSVLLMGGLCGYWLWHKNNISGNKQPKAGLSPMSHKIDEEYKNIRISDGDIEFTLRVPSAWLVETRNMEEKPMTKEQIVDFFKTDRDMDGFSDYYAAKISYFETLSFDKLQETLTRQKPGQPRSYPNASISPDGIIYYSDLNDQIDIYVLSESNAKNNYGAYKTKNFTWTDISGTYPSGSFKTVFLSREDKSKVVVIRALTPINDELKVAVDKVINSLTFLK